MINSIKTILCLFLFLFITSAVEAKQPTNSVVKVLVTNNRMDYYRPWQSIGVNKTTGSGAIINGNRILTNAHIVSDHTFIQVKKSQDPKKYTASVIAVGHDCDLALLSVDDPSFFEGDPIVRNGRASSVAGYGHGRWLSSRG